MRIYVYIQGFKMAQKRISISIDERLNDRWKQVADHHKITKSGMIEAYLLKILPKLEHYDESFIGMNVEEVIGIDKVDEYKSLFDDIEHDQGIGTYKEMKIG